MRVRQFVADASHELRTPLAAIRGYAELTRRGRDAGAARRGPRAGPGRVGERPDDHPRRRPAAAGPAGLRPPARRASRSTCPGWSSTRSATRTRPAGTTAGCSTCPTEPVDRAPATRPGCTRCVANLLANARTHTPPGTTVTARLATDSRRLRRAHASPTTGPGIPAELQPDVFERFARGDTSRSRAAGSTGLGLAIVAAVVEAHGGRVASSSRPGQTAFTVACPAPSGDADRAARASDGHSRRTAAPSGRPRPVRQQPSPGIGRTSSRQENRAMTLDSPAVAEARPSAS